MNVRELAETYNWNADDLEEFALKKSGLKVKSAYGGARIDDSLVDRLIDKYIEANPKLKEEKEERERAEEEALAAEAALEAEERARIRKATSQMLITSGFQFDGYKIVKYSGYISGDDAVSVDRGLAFLGLETNVKDELMASLVEIRRNALQELKEAAYNLGCNAVIGVDFDYLTLEPETANLNGGTTYLPYVFGVTANGNAVIIEKVEDDD